MRAVLPAAGYKLRWLLRMIAKKGLLALLWHLPAHLRSTVGALLSTHQPASTRSAAIELVPVRRV